MSKKAEYITELYHHKLREITQNVAEWRAFLHTAAFQYKYTFADQVLIYAQRPSATACAGIELWNNHFGRWVNKGATGIALIDGQGAKHYLRYVFDVSDTHHRENIPFDIWSIKPGCEADVIEALQNRFIVDDKTRDTISDAVIAASINLSSDNITDYLQELSNEKEGSYLEALDDKNLRMYLLLTVQASMAYVVLTRLGYNADDYIGKEAFTWVKEFNTSAATNILGEAVSDISEICLREIERTVRSVERTINNVNRTFDGNAKSGYNDGEKAKTDNENGGITDDINLQDRERSTDSELGDAGADELPARKVRTDAARLHEEASQGDVYDDIDGGQTEQLSSRDRRDGKKADRREHIEDGSEPWSDRADEAVRPDEMGTDDEQYQGDSGGAGVERSDLSLEQSVDKSNAAISDSTLPAIADPESLIQILRHGNYLRHSKEEIVSFLSSDAGEAEKVEYVRNAYPTLQFSEFYKTGTQQYLGYRADNNGLLLYEGNFPSRTAEMSMSWRFVTDLIGALIKDKNYLDKPKAKETDQLSFFDMDMPEVQKQAERTVRSIPTSDSLRQLHIPQEVIDEFLRLGGCVRNSAQRIYGFYRRANNQTENIAFLKREYEADSVGIIINDRKYAVKWDSDGVLISTGDSVSDISSTLLSWKVIDKRIRELLETGQYLPQSEAEKAADVWDNFVTNRISFMYRDVFENIPNEYKTTSKFVWPEVDEFYKNIILTPEKLEAFIKEVESNIARLDEYPPRIRLYLNPQEILGYLKSYRRDPVEFPTADPNILPPKQFVTQDKIDSFLIKQVSSVSGSKLRTYSFFLKHKELSERAKFLSGDYGQGGTAGLRTDNSHDGKGLFLCGGLQDKTTGAFLKWPQVAKRIEELIRRDKYLTDKEIAGLDLYEKKQIVGSIRSFYQDKSDVVKPYSAEYGMFDVDKIEADLFPQLENPERVKEILAEMQTVFDSEIPGSYHYDYDKEAIADLKAYAEGKYNLFPGSRYRRKEPVRKEETLALPVEEKKSADVDLSQYGLHIPLGTWLSIGTEDVQLSSVTEEGVELYNGTLFPLEMPLDVFVRRVKDNPLNEHLVVQDKPPTVEGTAKEKPYDESQNYPEDVHIYIDTDREELIWMYYNPDAASGGQFVTNSLAFKVFKEAYDDFMESGGNPNDNTARDKFIDSIGEMADQHLADINTPFFVEARVDYEEKPDYVDFTPDNILSIGRKIENYIVDFEAEQEANEHEAELGADGYRAFPGNRHEQESTEPLSIWQRYEQAKQLYPESVVAVRVGDFYEFFKEDAERASSILDLTLTSRQTDGAERVPMCGIPFHATEKYFNKLLDVSISVAIDDGDLTPRILLPNTRSREKRFVVVEVEDLSGDPYEVWDGEKNAIHIDENGNRSTFITRWQADDFASELNRLEHEKTHDRSGEAFYEGTEPEESTYEPELDVDSQKYDLGFGFKGNGLTVWNRLQEEHGDYKTIAHIASDRTVRFYDQNIPESVKKRIYEVAATSDGRMSATQDIPIFSMPPKLDSILSKEDEPEDRKTIPPFAEESKLRKTFPVYNSHPEIPDSEKHNYRITDDEIGMGGAKEKFRKNIAAINLLHELEFDNRLATPEEQEILAQYSGWGGLADAFDETKDNWKSEFTELYTTLSPEEYKAAEGSTLTAFYTPPIVIKAMYKVLENMGFGRGNVLEPSCGVGNFMGLIPDGMDAKIYGVELDSLSGRIARQLYQKNGITINGYEKTDFPDSFFDVAIGNVPFNGYKLLDKRYDKYNFLIHDYFFAKTLDKVRPGGVIAFITSNGTLDKQNPSIRKYISQRADFLGAIRLPNNTFNGAGAQKVVSDIIFLQKRDRIIEKDDDWIHLGKDENGIVMNQYFVSHPDMVLGEMVMRSGQYGSEPTCKAYEDENLSDLLDEAIANIHAEISEIEVEELTGEEADNSIPADPTVKNFSFTIVNGKVYYRQNSVMNPVQASVTGENRIKGMIAIRDTVRKLIDAQLDNAPDREIEDFQAKLNLLYDNFTHKYGLINSRGNAMVFSDDSSYFLLCSLEILDENKELKSKADMFYKRTIKPQVAIEHVDTASEALALSIGERAMVDMEYMSGLTGKSEEELFSDLKGVIFHNHEYGDKIGAKPYLMADEYLSGNVREKLREAKQKAEEHPEFAENVEALEKVQPVDLTAAEIGVRLGTTWIPDGYIQTFMQELLSMSYYAKRLIEVKYIPQTAQWVISNKSKDSGNVKVTNAYGTHRINAYEIIEQTLNLKDVRIFDYVYDENGNKQAVFNKKETMIAQGKQDQIKRAFDEWIWKDPARRESLCKLYNERFNSLRAREFDGSHIKFFGMNPEITLRKHQSDAVARIMYGGNSLLAHVVGAGKTFTMVAAAQESKRLGLCSKSMFVVPNHLIEQWASEYLQLYPSANILVATKKDFETKKRKKFCARIATGDYDAVIIGHSQFEKIPMSLERQIQTLETERDEILRSIEKIKESSGDRITVKQLAKFKKQIDTKLKKLNDQSRKDDVVTFEELGVDRLFVDEAHFYKNLAAYTKMRNVAGISQTEAQKSSDLYMKCRYLDELTGGKGCVFATGTPISNTMVELYTMQKYLQYDELQMRGLLNFDAWASTFGETVTAIELAPEGYNYFGQNN